MVYLKVNFYHKIVINEINFEMRELAQCAPYLTTLHILKKKRSSVLTSI